MKQGGHKEDFRKNITNKVIANYKKILVKHLDGENMYAKKKPLRNKSNKNKTDWFKQKGYKLTVQVPATRNEEHGLIIKNSLEGRSGEKILLQEKFGRTIVGSLAKNNPSPPDRCTRHDCIPCAHGMANNKCYQPNIGYRILCDRAPCNNNIIMTDRELQTNNLRRQLDKLRPGDQPPALYEGESFRSSYTRMKSHWSNYNNKSGQQKSFMWHHTINCHNSVIGKEKCKHDYKFVRTDTFRDVLSRLTDEGRRQTVMEEYQVNNRVIVLNSKIDFIQPMRTQLAITTKAHNFIPGQTNNNKYSHQRLYNNQPTTTTTNDNNNHNWTTTTGNTTTYTNTITTNWA